LSESPEPKNVLTFVNDGPLLVASDYWQSEIAAAGKLYVSINADCFRLLVPQSQHTVISDMRPKAKHIVVSLLPRDKWVYREYCLEWMVEDGSDTPWACHLSPGAVNRAPNHEDVGKKWLGSVWHIGALLVGGLIGDIGSHSMVKGSVHFHSFNLKDVGFPIFSTFSHNT
jgi:hypothetical protein